MSEIKYKGIDTEKIKEVQRVHLSDMPTDIVFERKAFEMKMAEGDIDLIKSMQTEIERFTEKQVEKRVEQIELYVICEMAKLYLEQCMAMRRIIERLEEQEKQHLVWDTRRLDGH